MPQQSQSKNLKSVAIDAHGRLDECLKKELRQLYEELATEQNTVTVHCHQCGACCNFKAFDHQLWATSLELDYLADTDGLKPVSINGVCPYMENNQCTARIGRTLGCRVFLCRQDALEMELLHEKYINKLRLLAEKYDIELEYNEFLASLQEL
ncbi:MAG: hypothetical protein JXR76_30615 [Deltaproteobacteria bacterium]|nr:hypothetical protein [Deltaproteobacteria bacterium]